MNPKSLRTNFVSLFKHADKNLDEIKEVYYEYNLFEETLKDIAHWYFNPKDKLTLLWLLETIQDKNFFSQFYFKCSQQNDSAGFQILLDKKIPTNFNLTTTNPLKDAVEHSHVEMAQYLLSLNIPYDKKYFSQIITQFYSRYDRSKAYKIIELFIKEDTFPAHDKILIEKIVNDDNLFLLQSFVEDKFDISYQKYRLFEISLYAKSSDCLDYLLNKVPTHISANLIYNQFKSLVDNGEYVYEGFVENLITTIFKLNIQNDLFEYLLNNKKEDSQLYKSLLFKKLSNLPETLDNIKLKNHKI